MSPLEEVNHLLRADKIQNYKDFLLHHRGTHPRRVELDRYFNQWLARLGVSRDELARWFATLQVSAAPLPLPPAL
ncbi:hypothetical protein WMF04_11090 [Sorangium sp. So ce260]|uniref:hypothetical protein n=1 Tax=Sorangium sp. So ce260 TaxID=3133291 RepID=UPI003F5E38A6